jgi:hypothetical protein
MKNLVINLVGGPGCGKSTTMAGVFFDDTSSIVSNALIMFRPLVFRILFNNNKDDFEYVLLFDIVFNIFP